MKAIALFICILIYTNYTHSQSVKEVHQYVDPFIGSVGHGNTFPGAALPYGMVKLGPDCGHKRSNSGYISGAEIHGFSHTHVSGTGGGAKYGNILVMPFTGAFTLNRMASKPKNEEASPGYFSVNLEKYKIQAEHTVTQHVGFHKYTFQNNNEKSILIDAGSFLGEGHCCGEAQEFIGSEMKIISATEMEGYIRVRGGWGKGGEYTVYFSAIFDSPASSFATWQGDRVKENRKEVYDIGEKTGAYFKFNNTTSNIIQVKVGVSHISCGKAKAYIQQEVQQWDFKKVNENAVSEWNKVLNTIDVTTITDSLKTIFYTALYHTMLMPTDKTGENPKWKSAEPYYDDFYAIWDTYRVTHPLLTLIQPKREIDMVRSLIDIYNYEGYMPDARSGNHTGRTQGGSNCDMVVADAYLKGLKGIDYENAYEAMVKNAEIPPGGDQQAMGRGGINAYITLGYVPAAYEPKENYPSLHIPKLYDRAGTRTVEYAANDWAIAQVAKGLGKEEDYQKYKTRASNWANTWRSVESEGGKGFIWPRDKNGNWEEDFESTRTGSWGNFFYEADSWEYSFYVPQDVATLIDSCGGKDLFIKRLDTFFKNGHYEVSNEPSFFTPCLYTYAGRQDRTNERIREIIDQYWTAQRNGIPGNDDAGSMSGWVIFNMLGFYPNAGQDIYIITSPYFDKATLNMGDNKNLNIISHDLSAQNTYIKKVMLNGKPLNRAWFRHQEIADGGTLEFFMDDKASDFGKNLLPPSLKDYK